MQAAHEVLAYQVKDAIRVSGLGQTTLFALMKSGELKSVKRAGRRLILREDLESYLRGAAPSKIAA